MAPKLPDAGALAGCKVIDLSRVLDRKSVV